MFVDIMNSSLISFDSAIPHFSRVFYCSHHILLAFPLAFWLVELLEWVSEDEKDVV